MTLRGILGLRPRLPSGPARPGPGRPALAERHLIAATLFTD